MKKSFGIILTFILVGLLSSQTVLACSIAAPQHPWVKTVDSTGDDGIYQLHITTPQRGMGIAYLDSSSNSIIKTTENIKQDPHAIFSTNPLSNYTLNITDGADAIVFRTNHSQEVNVSFDLPFRLKTEYRNELNDYITVFYSATYGTYFGLIGSSIVEPDGEYGLRYFAYNLETATKTVETDENINAGYGELIFFDTEHLFKVRDMTSCDGLNYINFNATHLGPSIGTIMDIGLEWDGEADQIIKVRSVSDEESNDRDIIEVTEFNYNTSEIETYTFPASILDKYVTNDNPISILPIVLVFSSLALIATIQRKQRKKLSYRDQI